MSTMKSNLNTKSVGPKEGTEQCMMSYLLDVLADWKNAAKYYITSHYTVIRKPDYNGGHYFELQVGEKVEQESLKDFEYIEWEGSYFQFMQLMNEGHEFMAHSEPLYEPAVEYPMSAQKLFADYVAWWIDNLISHQG